MKAEDLGQIVKKTIVAGALALQLSSCTNSYFSIQYCDQDYLNPRNFTRGQMFYYDNRIIRFNYFNQNLQIGYFEYMNNGMRTALEVDFRSQDWRRLNQYNRTPSSIERWNENLRRNR